MIDVVRMADYGLSDVANRDASRRMAALGAVMGMPVKDGIGSFGINRFRQKIAPQKGIDLTVLPEERRFDRREMKKHETVIGFERREPSS